MGELTVEQPKGLVGVAGKPLLSHVFETLIEAGVDDVVVVIGYRGEQIVDHYGDSYRDVSITYVEQEEPRGLGHAVLQAAPYVDGSFVVLNGDNVFGGSITPVIECAIQPDVDAAIAVEEASRSTATETGVVERTGDQITGLVEKPDDPPSTLVTTGCYVLPAAIFHAIRLLLPSDRGEYELSDGVDLLLLAGYTVAPVPVDSWRVNVNRPADIDRVTRLLCGEY